MSYPIDRGFGYPQSPKPESVEDLAEEMVAARTKFPGNRLLFAALVEEVGELAEALTTPFIWDRSDWSERINGTRLEAKQSACVAMRLYEEGDPAFGNGVGLGSPFAALVKNVGELARCYLQRKDPYLPLSNIKSLVEKLAMHGDPMFADVTDEEAKA